MTEPHIDSRTLSLVTPGGLTSEVTVRALTALQLFDYQTYLADVEWPAQPPEGDDKAAHKYTLQVQRVVYELNATMAAYGLHYLNPADTLDEARQRGAGLIFLSAVPDSAAARLYQRLGFAPLFTADTYALSGPVPLRG